MQIILIVKIIFLNIALYNKIAHRANSLNFEIFELCFDIYKNQKDNAWCESKFF